MIGRLAAVLLACGAAVAAPADDGATRLRELARARGQTEPVVRIGLEPAPVVRVGAGGSFRVIDPANGNPVWRDSFSGTLAVVADGLPAGGIARIYRVQVGAFGDRASAEAELARLTRVTGASGVVRHDPDRDSWRVRLGEAGDRLELTPLTERLRAAGVTSFWIAEEPAVSAGGVTLRLVDAAWESHPTGLTRLALVPASGGHVEVEGKRYRGVLELRVGPAGEVRPIDWVGLEQYLLGVVPAELGPEVWPQPDALRAQAVAARTYVWRNRGQFEEEGFDLCATPRCQVYEGLGVEHPMSDRAVLATRGEVLTFEGEPIIALYTATCGGHTENGGLVFADHDRPYLVGVPCRAEGDALATLRGELRGARIQPVVDESGRDVTREWALLRSTGVLAAEDVGARLAEPLTAQVLRRLTAALAGVAGLPAPAGDPGAVDGLGAVARSLVADLGWAERAELLVAGEDVPALLRDDEAAGLGPPERRALAYLAWVEAIAPGPDGRYHVERTPSVARLLPALGRAAESYRAFDLREGVVSGVGASSVRLLRGKGEVRVPLGREPFVLGRTAGRPVPVERLELWPGDRVAYRTDARGAVDFLELLPPVKGTSDDRTAAVYSWEVRKTRRELEASIEQRVAVGKLRNLEVLERGVSGRIAALRVTGSRGETVVRGFDVRRLLDLRESLTVVEVQRDGAGEIAAVVFAGKGWGHGVGLCQVGAYGMALRGVSYREILAHYYRGTSIERLHGPSGR